MALYEVKGYHHKQVYRRGDLEDETIIVFSEAFTTRKAANELLKKKESEFKRRGYQCKSTYASRGSKVSEVLAFTGNTWIHENSGEKQEEYFYYKINQK